MVSLVEKQKRRVKHVRHKQPEGKPFVAGKEDAGIKAITCPKCGGAIQAPEGTTRCYCAFCGAQLLIDDGSRTVTYRTVDEARIKEAEIEESLELRRLEIEERRRPGKAKAVMALGILGLGMMIIGVFAGHDSGDANSPWYMLSMVGLYPLLGACYIGFTMLPSRKD